MKTFRIVSGTAAALALATGLAAAQPAAADDRLSPGAAAAIGAIGGIALGAAIASQPPVYAAPAPVYVAPPPPRRRVIVEESEPVYYRPAPRRVYVERCTTERVREWVPGWGWEHRTRRVCH